MNTRNLILAAAAVAAGLCAGQVCGATIQSVGSGFWDVGTTWSGGNVPTNTDDVTITNGCTVTIQDMATHVVSNLTIQTGGVVTHQANTTTEAYKCILSIVSNLTIEGGGSINVDLKGYAGGNGPGAGAAGAHGGQGGIYGDGQSIGVTYGSVTSPTNCGSGGWGGAGGGAVCLVVNGMTTVHGAITSSGVGPAHYQGAGGSIYLTTGSLAGSGTLKANGGWRDNDGACAGGGRIAVILTNATDFGSVRMQAYGGYSSTPQKNRGAAGTVYRQSKDQAAGQGILTVDNNNQTTESWSATLIGSQVLDTAVGTVIVTNAAKLTITNQTLTVCGDLNNCATFRGDYGSTVAFAGTNAATISGTNTFHNFTSTNLNCTQESEAKRLNFQEARTNTVNGVLTLTGVRVDSIGGVSTWGLKANPALTHSVSNVWAGRSDASSGSQITAYDSTNMDGNVNWVFRKSGLATNTWLGAVSTVWNVGGNWSEGRPTDETDEVVIPTNGYWNYPVLDVTRRVKSLAISNAAAMSLGGFDLTVDGAMRSAGALTAVGAATIRVGGDLDFSGGGTFNAASSTVWIAGSATQTVVSAGNAFYLLTISNSAAPVVFADAVMASNLVNMANPVTFGGAVTVVSLLRTYGTNVSIAGALTAGALDNRNGALVCSGAVTVAAFTNWAGDLTFRDDVTAGAFYSAPGGMTHTFRDGKTVTVGNLEWYGRSGYPVVLRSASDGSAWNLNVTNWSKVRQVDVKDSNAAGGQTLYPVASTDSGRNTNWVFGGPWQTWVGSVSPSFTNGGNWTPAGVPDGSTYVLVEGYEGPAPVLTGAATVQCVIVGSVTTATLTVNGTLKANGGWRDNDGACAGGGRIAVILTNATDFGSVRMQAYGGYSSTPQKNRGAAGTVYRQSKDQAAGQGTLTVDNNNQTTESWSATLIGSLVRDAIVGTVIVTNAGKLAVSNATLTVRGDWIVAGGATFVAQTNSTVDFAGATAATIYTNNTFFNLTCTNAGKTLVFEAGRTNTVTGLLKLGSSQSGQTVTLQSTTNGIWSYLALAPGGTQAIARVNVKDNNAGGGQTLLASGGSANGGNNINWQFPPSGTMFMVK